jgi:hypothetical protein
MQIVQLIVNRLILRELDWVESVTNPGEAGESVRWVCSQSERSNVGGEIHAAIWTRN